MNFDRSLLFSWLEEDNIQRAYFRVRPLLTMEGDVRAEAEQLWPDEGCLRIVPDRNEQHTFKVRMRTLGAYCVVDLTNQPAEASKIRTNKNYKPEKGEMNQFILYSDTVHALPEHTFYQLVDGTAAGYAEACEAAITPLFYLREGDTLYGPLRKDGTSTPEPAKEAAGTLFDIPCPDGVTRSILCIDDAPVVEKPATEEAPAEPPVEKAEAPVAEVPKAEEEPKPETPKAEKSPKEGKAPAKEEKPEDAPLPIGEALTILDETKNFEETLQTLDKPLSKGANLLKQSMPKPVERIAPILNEKPGDLSGTPLVRTPLKTSVQLPKNKVQEVVSSQWMVGKYEPPAQNLPSGTAMRKVENPVEKACSSLRSAWHAADARGQLVDFILSLDGIHAQLEPKLCQESGVTVMQKVLRDRLQDLEAERLTALCELDKAKRDVDAYKQELIHGLASRIQRETGTLEETRAACEKQVADLKAEVAGLSAQRDALMAKVDELQGDLLPAAVAKMLADAHMLAPTTGIPLRIAPVSGETLTLEQLIARMMTAFAAFGQTLDRNTAIAGLALLALCPRIGVACPTPAPLSTLMKNLMNAFGWQGSYAHQISAEQKPVVAQRPADSTPALLVTSLPNYAPVQDVSKVLLSHSASNLTRNAAYDACQWPVVLLPNMAYVPEVENVGTPVSAASFKALLEMPVVPDEVIAKVLEPVLNAAPPLAGAARKEMFRFVSICAGLMEGGLPVAVDWAILYWVLPMLERNSRATAAVKALLDEYPLSLAKI